MSYMSAQYLRCIIIKNWGDPLGHLGGRTMAFGGIDALGARHWLRAWSKPLASRVRAPSREIFASRGREQNIYRV